MTYFGWKAFQLRFELLNNTYALTIKSEWNVTDKLFACVVRLRYDNLPIINR